MMSYESLLIHIQDGIAAITINRPKSLNALNTALLHELYLAAREIEENDDVRVVVLTGAGEKAFVAGADISELARFNALEAKYFVTNGH